MIELAEKLPGPDGLPLIGNALMLLGSSDSKVLTLQLSIINVYLFFFLSFLKKKQKKKVN